MPLSLSLFRDLPITGIFILATLTPIPAVAHTAFTTKTLTHVKFSEQTSGLRAQIIDIQQPPIVQFQQAIQIGDTKSSKRNYSLLSNSEKISLLPFLKSFAEQNYTLSQWFYMDALFLNQQINQAGNWLYIASLGTQLDSILCARPPREAELHLTQYFDHSFSMLRQQSEQRLSRMMEARFFHETRLDAPRQPAWVCLTYDPIVKPTNARRFNLQRELSKRMISPEEWRERRTLFYKKYLRDTGLDQIPDHRLLPEF